MQKMDGKSLDLVEVNRRAVMEALKEVAPEVVSESGVDLEKLAILIGEDKNLSDKLERYNFTWPDKRKAIKSALTPSSGTLRPAPKESVNWDNTKNLYIEGDNLEVLKLLQKSYFGKIKMIYIDPPYNTGKEFVYPDDYADNIQNYLELTGQINESGRRITTNTETSGRYHTNWLNMMYPRLKLARNLLRDDGVIFISIDDHEVSNLRKICDEIFGEENFVGELIWHLSSGVAAGHFTRANEYILVYAKLKESLPYFDDTTGGIIKHGALKKISSVNPASPITFKAGSITFEGDSKTFTGEIGGSEKQLIEGELVFKNGVLAKDVTITAGWAMRNQLISWLNGKETLDSKGQRVLKFYFNSQGVLFYEKERGTLHPKTVLPNEVGNTKVGTDELFELFGLKVMDFPKPTSLLRFLIRVITSSAKDSIILDFFSGSATTAHAVMELNKEDGGNRQFIMVQLPEPCGEDSEAFKAGYKNICEIGKERIRRVIKKIDAEYAESEKSTQGELDLGAPAKQKPDLGFKVFKLDTSNFIPWDSNPDNLSEESLQQSLSNIKLDRSQQDLLYELFLKLGVTLNTPYQKVELAGKYMYDIGYGSIYACLDDDLDMDFCKAMIAYHDAQFPKEESKDKKEERELEKYRLETTTFIFRDSSFADDNIKTNILQTLRQMGLTNIRAI